MSEGIKTNKFLTVVAACFLIGFSFYLMKELQSILLPFFIALIITFLFEPFYEWMKSKRIPNGIAIVIVVIVILIIANISSVFVLTSINTFTNQIPKYTDKAKIIFSSLVSFLSTNQYIGEYIKENANITNLVSGEKIAGILTKIFSGIAGLFADFILVLIYVIFLLTEFVNIKKRILKAFSSERSRKIADTMTDIFIDVKKYIVGKTLINLIHGTIFTIILFAFGVDFYLVWGFMAFLLAFIPNIGSLISTLFPFLTALIQFDGELTRPLIILILMIATANIIGNLVEPKVLGDKLNLSPILLLVSLIFWGYLWGIIGMILSVPIMSMIKIILSKFEQTRPISILMSYNVTEAKKKKTAEAV